MQPIDVMQVYVLSSSSERERPVIDFTDPHNARNDWERLGEVTDLHWPDRHGILRDPRDYRLIDLIVDDPEATNWDCYLLPGGLNMLWSARVVAALERVTWLGIRYLNARLNGLAYAIPYCAESLDLLDRNRSRVSLWPPPSTDIKAIDLHVFKRESLVDLCIFCIPEAVGTLYATAGVVRILEAGGFRGLQCDPLVHAEADSGPGGTAEMLQGSHATAHIVPPTHVQAPALKPDTLGQSRLLDSGQWSVECRTMHRADGTCAAPHDLSAVEAVLGRPVPSVYRRFFENYPARLREAFVNLGWKRERLSEAMLLDNAGQLLYWNELVRLPGASWMRARESGWPVHMMVIGHDSSGNYWCIDACSETGAVWFYNHELGRIRPCASSLAAHVEALLGFAADLDSTSPSGGEE
jgi:hypothetical protein